MRAVELLRQENNRQGSDDRINLLRRTLDAKTAKRTDT